MATAAADTSRRRAIVVGLGWPNRSCCCAHTKYREALNNIKIGKKGENKKKKKKKQIGGNRKTEGVDSLRLFFPSSFSFRFSCPLEKHRLVP